MEKEDVVQMEMRKIERKRQETKRERDLEDEREREKERGESATAPKKGEGVDEDGTKLSCIRRCIRDAREHSPGRCTLTGALIPRATGVCVQVP